MFSRTFQAVTLLAILLLGGLALYHRDRIQSPADMLALVTDQFQLNFGSVGDVWQEHEPTKIASRPLDRIRVGCLRVPEEVVSNESSLLYQQMTRLVTEFDVVTLLQNPPQPELIQSIVDSLNQSGGSFRFFVDTQGHGYAVVFDDRRVQLEQDYFYTVNDPDGLFGKPPLVAWFRCSGADARAAFTFSLVSYQLDSRTGLKEISYLDSLFRAVREDGRGEDDILVVGDVNLNPAQLERVAQRAGLFRSVGSKIAIQPQQDILIQPAATVELGATGKVDLLRKFNLSSQELERLRLGDPVWAEFSIREGERPASDSTHPNWSRPMPAPAQVPSYEYPAPPALENKTADTNQRPIH